MELEEKTHAFYTALTNCYRNEDDRDMQIRTMKIQPDMTEDISAMLLAMFIFFRRITGEEENDLVGFTHFLNRLAIQNVFGDEEEDT